MKKNTEDEKKFIDGYDSVMKLYGEVVKDIRILRKEARKVCEFGDSKGLSYRKNLQKKYLKLDDIMYNNIEG